MTPLPALQEVSDAPSASRGAGATLVEVFSLRPADGAATAFVLAQLPPGAQVLWVQDRSSRLEGGRPYAPAIKADFIYLEVPRARDALWAMEQALACADLSAVVCEVWDASAALDFTATKRLALRAEAGGAQAWLLRGTAAPDLSAARERWRVASLASQEWAKPSWRVTLFRSRLRSPAEWVASHDGRRLTLDRSPGVEAARTGSPSRRSRPAA